jgi:chorismate mutase / prephenate dehydratase
MELGDIRNKIDDIDAELSALFQQRMALAMEVAQFKQAHSLAVLDTARERTVIERAEKSIADERIKPAVRRFFEGIMAESRQLQQVILAVGKPAGTSLASTPTVAFLGPVGSFSHEAVAQHFGAGATAIPSASFDEIVDSVASGAVPLGILPVENSLTGGIFAVTDLLSTGAVHIVGETVLGVRHCLLGVPGATVDSIETVLSHPQPLEQCRQFIRRQGYAPQASGSTAGAAQEVTARQDVTLGAIASEAAGRLHGLVPLVHDIQDNPANFTRFVVVSAASQTVKDANKISAVFVVEHRPGTLYGTLSAFASRGINLVNLVSRPMPGSPWQYCFHMDFDGSLSDATVQAALAEAEVNCRSIKILGNYMKWEG